MNYYEELEVSRKASAEVIDAAYKRLSLQYRPYNGEPRTAKKIKRLNEAYEVISDKNKRNEYDKSIEIRQRNISIAAACIMIALIVIAAFPIYGIATGKSQGSSDTSAKDGGTTAITEDIIGDEVIAVFAFVTDEVTDESAEPAPATVQTTALEPAGTPQTEPFISPITQELTQAQTQVSTTQKPTAAATTPPPAATAKPTQSVPASITGVKLNKSDMKLSSGKTETLKATVSPSNASNKDVTWSSSNPSVATVNNNGLVTAVSSGTAIITAAAADDSNLATCTVTVPEEKQPETAESTQVPVATAVAENPADTSEPLEKIVNEQGNTTGNITNGALAAQQGDWVYYCNRSEGFKLYKIRTGGTGKQKLSDDNSMYINVVGDWVYYSNGSGKGELCKIRTDGTGREKLNDDGSIYINVAGDWAYYRNRSDGDKLYRVRTDGTGREKLGDDSSLSVNVADDWIYYRNQSDGDKLYRVRTDGTGREKLGDDYSMYINVAGDWVYYYSSGSGTLYKIRTDGSDRQILNDNYSINYPINVAGDWIYFRDVDYDGDFKLYKIRADGTGRQKLSDDNIMNINVVGDWIYYANVSDNYNLYKVRTDGTQRQLVD